MIGFVIGTISIVAIMRALAHAKDESASSFEDIPKDECVTRRELFDFLLR